MSIEAAIIGVDQLGKMVVLKPELWQIAFALVSVCDQATLSRAEGTESSGLDVIAFPQGCVQAIAESLDTSTKIDTLYDELLADDDIQAQTASYVAEERASFETSLRRFIVEASRWFAEAATNQWDVTLELSL